MAGIHPEAGILGHELVTAVFCLNASAVSASRLRNDSAVESVAAPWNLPTFAGHSA
jgi:hypothetical protein